MVRGEKWRLQGVRGRPRSASLPLPYDRGGQLFDRLPAPLPPPRLEHIDGCSDEGLLGTCRPQERVLSLQNVAHRPTRSWCFVIDSLDISPSRMVKRGAPRCLPRAYMLSEIAFSGSGTHNRTLFGVSVLTITKWGAWPKSAAALRSAPRLATVLAFEVAVFCGLRVPGSSFHPPGRALRGRGGVPLAVR